MLLVPGIIPSFDILSHQNMALRKDKNGRGYKVAQPEIALMGPLPCMAKPTLVLIYSSLQVNQAPAYGKMLLSENGVSGMEFHMEINMKEYKAKRLTKTSNVGKWNSAQGGAIDYKTGSTTKMQMAATNVYKVAVVVVSDIIISTNSKQKPILSLNFSKHHSS